MRKWKGFYFHHTNLQIHPNTSDRSLQSNLKNNAQNYLLNWFHSSVNLVAKVNNYSFPRK